MAYKLRNFLENVEKHVTLAQEEEKKQAIGLVIHSLQRPFQELMTGVILEQEKQVTELIKYLGWEKKI